MAPSRHGLLALLGLVASTGAIPAPIPNPQIGLTPPKQSVSWDLGNPEPTKEPVTPSLYPPVYPPKPSDQISLGPPSFSISWDGPGPTEAPEEPEDPEIPEEPGLPGFPPKPSDQFSLGPPSVSISWDGPGPTEAPEPGYPEEPEEPEYPPQPSDQFSLGPPSVSISWSGPGPTEEPEYPDDPEEPEYPPQPSDQFSLGPPSVSISWSGPGPTDEPEPPKPSDGISLGQPSASISWEGPGPVPTSESEEPTKSEYPPGPHPPQTSDYTIPSPPWGNTSSWDSHKSTPTPESSKKSYPHWSEPAKTTSSKKPGEPYQSVSWGLHKHKRREAQATTPPKIIGVQPPTYSSGWGKRQFSYDPHPTDVPQPEPGYPEYTPEPYPEDPEPEPYPEDPEEPTPEEPEPYPEDPEEPTPEEPEPYPEDPEMPGGPGDMPGFPAPTPSDDIGIQPPVASISWGKRDPAPQTNSYGIGNPTRSFFWPKPPVSSAYVSWGKRQFEGPTDIPAPPAPTPSDEIGMQPPEASISWGKRNPEPQTNSYGFGIPTRSLFWPKPPMSSSYVSWGRRDPEPQAETIGLVWPTNIPKPSFFLPGNGDGEGEGTAPPINSGYMSWGRRNPGPEPTTAAKLADRDALHECASATKTFSKIHPCPKIGCAAKCDYSPEYMVTELSGGEHAGCTATVDNVCPTCDCPYSSATATAGFPGVPSYPSTITPVPMPTPISPPTFPEPSRNCTGVAGTTTTTTTLTIVPPCVPPACPATATPCDLDRPVRRMERRVVKKDESEGEGGEYEPTKCEGENGGEVLVVVTKTVTGTCPTWTCVPGCDLAQVVR